MKHIWARMNDEDRANAIGYGALASSFILELSVIHQYINPSDAVPLSFLQIVICLGASLLVFFIVRNAMLNWYEREKNENRDNDSEPPREAGTA
jgi:hypothetical protein